MSNLQKLSLAAGLALATLVVGVAPAAAQATVNVTASWTSPGTGSPVDHYVVQMSTDGGPYTQVGTSSTTSFNLTLPIGGTYLVRVVGVDDAGRLGPYSDPSDPYTPDLGPPGQPGKPIVM